ncbi:MAG: glutamine-synthetase adenylyltransferase, partial [Polaromonas sp.]|nr:glutamine-synthetase adenylyltransferase [Polaromonas sp.]
MTSLSTVFPDTPAAHQASAYSRFVQRIRRRYADQMTLLPAGAPRRPGMQTALDALLASGLETGAALRVLRQLVLERLVVLDCGDVAPTLPTACGARPPEGAGLAWGGPALAAAAPTLPTACGARPPEGAGLAGDNPAPAASTAGVALQVVTQAMTELAELELDVAMQHSRAQLDAAHGTPQAEGGGRAQMWVVGMGKLGARELNVSSDIDLIYVYDQDGETTGRSDGDGRGQISNHEYFARQVRAVFSLIGDVTEHGFVFRVDLALRPNGNSGPAAMSLSALEDYFQAQGREWERFAWLKSRVVSPLDCIQSGSAQALRGSVLPFVFRRYLDYS